jgi:hypothetical protein
LIRPVYRLKEKHRYAVGITRALTAKDGTPLAPPPGFQAILDGKITTDARLERTRSHYDAIFPALDAAGAPRDSLLLAWDFTVASDASVTADLSAAAAGALAAIQATPQTFTIETDGPGDDPSLTSRYLEGHFDAPRVTRDPSGHITIDGIYRAKLYAEVPSCAATAGGPIPVLVYGHGLMGLGSQIKAHDIQYLANNLCAVIVATDWHGMSTDDLASVAAALEDISFFPTVVDNLIQGIVDFIALEQIARAALTTPLPIDSTRAYYYGNSQGGIYGGTFLTYDPFIQRGILGVPGGNYSLLLDRSVDWAHYATIMYAHYNSPLDQELLLALLQMQWDAVDPITTAASLLDTHHILMMEARGDTQVPNIGTENEARVMGIPVLAPSVPVPYGLTAVLGPLPSALVIYDQHKAPVPPLSNTPASMDNKAHGSMRGLQAAQDLMKSFLETGQITQTCGNGIAAAPCDCPTDAVCGPPI